MYFSLLLTEEGLDPEDIGTIAKITIGKDKSGSHINEITLNCKVKCDGLNENKLKELAATTKEKCLVSRLYFGGTADINVYTELIK